MPAHQFGQQHVLRCTPSCETEAIEELTTPKELERELGISAKLIRDFLRYEFGLLAKRKLTRWQLTSEEAARVRAYFRAKHY